MKKVSLSLLVVASLAIAGTGGAQSSGPMAGRDGVSRGRGGGGNQNALAQIARHLAGDLARLPRGALVVASPLATTDRVRFPGRLAARVAKVVAGALGRNAQSHDGPTKLEHGRTLAATAGTLVYLSIELAGGSLRVTADVYPVPKRFWDRVRDPRPGPIRHAFASHRIDAEIQTFLPPIPLVASAIHKAASPERDVVAIACDDLDGDGALELILVARRRIHVGRIRAGKFVSQAAVSWSNLSAIAPSPLREPIGSVAVVPGSHLDVGITDREKGVRLDTKLEKVAELASKMPWPVGGCSAIRSMAVDPAVRPCVRATAERLAPAASTRFAAPSDAIAAGTIWTPDGALRVVRSGRVANRDVAILEDSAGRHARVAGVGAQLAVADLDRDGEPELLAGADTLSRNADALVVRTWKNDGTVVERLRVAVPSGVQALAACPPTGVGMAPIAIATGGAIWVVR